MSSNYKNWSLDRCNEELGAAGHYSQHNDIYEARAAVVAMIAEYETNEDSVKAYAFHTDSEHGYIHARNWDEAKQMLRDMIPYEALRDGAWGWVQDINGSRHEIGKCY